MSALDQGRLLTAEVKWGGDSGAIFWAGTAPIHQFWPRLAPQFSAALLAPQRRMDGEVVAWTWRESDRDETITVAELLALRALLGTSLESFRKAQPPHNESTVEGSCRRKAAPISICSGTQWVRWSSTCWPNQTGIFCPLSFALKPA